MEGDPVKKFIEFCSCSEEEAKRYLEAADHDFDNAIDLFFSSERPKEQKQESSGIHTLSKDNVKKPEEEGQAFYVGGSEGGGGQQVLGPKKDKDFISKIFSSAKENGADVLDKERYEKKSGFKAFSGNAFVLGDDLNRPSRSRPSQGDSDSEQEEEFIVKLWSDGLSLNDGPLRDYHDPQTIAFITSIRNGTIPPELVSSAGNKKINLLLEDHKEENYQPPPKPKIKPFSGTGNVLGHPTNQFKESVLSQSAPVVGTVAKVEVDESKPKTKIQVRLISGGKLVLELNHDHTVASIKQEIMHREPVNESINFALYTAHPVKLLDPNQTIKEANLINSVVIQKLC